MYQNMTREEMIQRLYDGNFTTGELERQLIAKLFEQCCGGGGSSGGGGAFVVNVSYSEDTFTMDKTAKEIWEAAQSSTILVKMPTDEGAPEVMIMSSAKKYIDASRYMFVVGRIRFMADGDDVYPYNSGEGGQE